ncbi:MAG: ribonuclease III [Clostridia bacterium]
MTINEKLEVLQKDIEYTFKDSKLLRIALTHKSYAYEQKTIAKNSYNERIEYLGDAILEHIISYMLFKITPPISEGEMSKKRAEIVCEKSLSDAFKSFNGEDYIFLGKCELATKGRTKEAILADAFEALLGAIYLDSDFETANRFVLKMLDKQIHDSLNGETKVTDYKTLLQELLQKNGNVNIKYNVIKETGPDHDKSFVVEVLLNDKKLAEGSGKSRKHAEQLAAEVAYAEFK